MRTVPSTQFTSSSVRRDARLIIWRPPRGVRGGRGEKIRAGRGEFQSGRGRVSEDLGRPQSRTGVPSTTSLRLDGGTAIVRMNPMVLIVLMTCGSSGTSGWTTAFAKAQGVPNLASRRMADGKQWTVDNLKVDTVPSY